ncbi:MAG: type II secretion system minor pseudopilin GspJ [Woeseiaceae bacterium]|nr:type II secretion system minor pseudopilin GspJ [Woeseiaceae bacterium]
MLRRNTGFTLIEVLVALAVFGVMSMLAYTVLGSTLSNADYLTERMERLQSVQRAMRYLSSDLMQASPRPVRSDLGDSYVPAVYSTLSSDFALEITHGGWGNPAGLPRSTLQRVAYRIEEDDLLRYHWGVLDRTYSNEPIITVLLEGVDSLFFRFYDGTGTGSEVWPPQQQGGSGMRLRPRAVEIVLSLPDQGEITRLLEVAP